MEIFISCRDVWNEKKPEELFNRLNPKRARLRAKKEETQSNSTPIFNHDLFYSLKKMVAHIFKTLKTSLRFVASSQIIMQTRVPKKATTSGRPRNHHIQTLG